MRFLWALPALAWAVPHFDVDLDLPPKQRWLQVVDYYREEIVAMMAAWSKTLDEQIGDQQAQWLKAASYESPEFHEELQGIHEALGGTVDLNTMILFNYIYEMESPTLTACSGFVTASLDGKAIHGRNMDYSFQFVMPDGTKKDWPDVTFEVTYWKSGQRIFLTVSWPVSIGAHTALRFNGWTFEQNTRLGLNKRLPNLEAGLQGGKMFGWSVRKFLETVPDFQTAVQRINATSFMAPQYFVLSGAKDSEGAVISMDRTRAQSLPDTPAVRFLGEGNWYLLQTNDDVNKPALDYRRPLALAELDQFSTADVSVDFVWDVIHNFPLKNGLSVFTWVGVPRTNYSQTVILGQDPATDAPTTDVHLMQRLVRRQGVRRVITDEGVRFQ